MEGNMENNNQEPQQNDDMVVLEPIKSLENNEFKHKLLLYTMQNNPEFFTEAAELNALNVETQHDLINEIVYQEQIMTLDSLCREAALQENTLQAYNYLHVMCFFTDKDYAYIQATEGENASTQLYTYIEDRLKNVDDLKNTLGLINIVNQAYLYTASEMPDFNTYKANQILEKMNAYESTFSDEQKAQSAYIVSKMFRKLEENKNVFKDTRAVGQEYECLRKVLANSNDYKLLSYCQSRIGYSADKEVVRAYKKALQSNKDKQSLFNINMALAHIYEKQSQQIGFATAHSSKHLSAEKAMRYLTNAYRYSDKKARMQILKKMAGIHLNIGNFEEWKNLKTVIALKYLKGEERCWALNAIGDKLSDGKFYQMAIDECDKAKMPMRAKLDIKEITFEKMLKLATNAQEKSVYASSLQNVKSQKQQIFMSLLNGKKKSII